MKIREVITENPLVAKALDYAAIQAGKMFTRKPNIAANALPTMPQNVPGMTHAFRTERGSTYAFNSSTGASVRNRSGANHASATTGIQPKSERTVFMNLTTQEANQLASLFQMGNKMQLQPIAGNRIQVVYAENYGPKRAGEVFWTSTKPYSTQPQMGLSPVEIYNKAATSVHVGSRITELVAK
jgi:hypothetical protein